MMRFLYRLLRVADMVGRVDETKLRAAMRSPSMLESLIRLAEMDKPLSYSLPMTGDAMTPLFNTHLMSSSSASTTPASATSATNPSSTTDRHAQASMKRDTLVIRKLNPNPQAFLNRVHVNDVVVIQDPHDDRRKYVRRITAMEGTEMVSSVPGERPFRIPDEHCWVLRDNHNAGTAPDSRAFGPLNLKYILGRVMYAIRSATDHGRVTNSPYGMATDAIVLAQEPVTPFIDTHGKEASATAKPKQDEGASERDGKL